MIRGEAEFYNEPKAVQVEQKVEACSHRFNVQRQELQYRLSWVRTHNASHGAWMHHISSFPLRRGDIAKPMTEIMVVGERKMLCTATAQRSFSS